MLPKFANHLLQHTSRVAASSQGLRNFLGLPAGPSSSSSLGGWNGVGSSSWGGHGAGAGGAKYNAGGKFYGGYTGAGRSVTQADSSAINDGNSGQYDDADESLSTSSQPRTRLRSSSLILRERIPLTERIRVSGATRLLHSRPEKRDTRPRAQDDNEPRVDGAQLAITDVPSSSREYSTVLSSHNLDPAIGDISPAHSTQTPVGGASGPADPFDPASPQSYLPPTPPWSEPADCEPDASLRKKVDAAVDSKNYNKLVELSFSLDTLANVADYNIVLSGLVKTRYSGQPINVILGTYNRLVDRNIPPNLQTFQTILIALCQRDAEVHKSLEALRYRIARRKAIGRDKTSLQLADEATIKQLEEETNFVTAMAIFQMAVDSTLSDGQSIGVSIANVLLRSCSYAKNVESAIRVFSHLERSQKAQPNINSYRYLISTYVNAGDINGASVIFREVKNAAQNGFRGVALDGSSQLSEAEVRNSHMAIWNTMIAGHFLDGKPEEAITLLEEMLDKGKDVNYSLSDVPPPSSSTYAKFIEGFICLGDIKTALAWFNQMLQQEATPAEPMKATLVTPRPNQICWNLMIESLVLHGMRAEANNLFHTLLSVSQIDSLHINPIHRIVVFEANLHHMQSSACTRDEADALVPFIMDDLLSLGGRGGAHRGLATNDSYRQMVQNFAMYLAKHHFHDHTLELLQRYVSLVRSELKASGVERLSDALNGMGVRALVTNVGPFLFNGEDNNFTLAHLLKYSEFRSVLSIADERQYAPQFLHAYYSARDSNQLGKLTLDQWEFLAISAAAYVRIVDQDPGYPFPCAIQFQGLAEFIRQPTSDGLDISSWSLRTREMVSSALRLTMNEEEIKQIFLDLNCDWNAFSLGFLADGPRSENMTISAPHGRYVDEWFPPNKRVSPEAAWTRYVSGVQQGIYPQADTIARFINYFGRKGDLKKVHGLYQDAQKVISYTANQNYKATSWQIVEDNMIVALAHGGDIAGAHTHRQRLLDRDLAPSADAYGSLILNVKETTDDSALSLALWNEAQENQIVPNIFLFNTVISKLSKARKADCALDIFRQMKADGVLRPTSVTYGAVIAACCRVGDAQSAETLFEEMIRQPNFKARVPPYNTMLQLYTHTKPDRERALYYYDQLIDAGISPTAHTYKLLLDCYGTIQPIDLEAMRSVFDSLVSDASVPVQGVHWASVINALGCVQRDLQSALQIFDSIPSHPSSTSSSVPLPDAVSYEAILNVFVTHRRTDLITTYAERLKSSTTRMTAYIANLFIKGYAASGDLEMARKVFEEMADPPVGVAAPYNHAPHELDQTPSVEGNVPVFREPSTWEAMIRAELGNGNRDQAHALLHRLQTRQYPAAVFQRISGIMHDEPELWQEEETRTVSPSDLSSASR